jgi:hypothetical protein
MSKLPEAASILAFLIFNLLILNWLRGLFWCLGFGAFLELGTWSLELFGILELRVSSQFQPWKRRGTTLSAFIFSHLSSLRGSFAHE